MKVLIDLNVILDTLLEREPFYADSAQAMALVETNKVEGVVAAHSLTTLFYLVSRQLSTARARTILTDLLQVVRVAGVGQATIERSLQLPYRDFEDAVQMAAAMGAGAQFVVTRNIKDFKAGPLPTIQPVELVALLKSPPES
jgi:predicted nucleic acid-binding protein